MARAVEIHITGEVQGVSYRAYAAHEAVRLEVAGWIRNEVDGTVSAYLEGDDDAVQQMIEWCRVGAPGAHVDDVQLTDVDARAASSFEIVY